MTEALVDIRNCDFSNMDLSGKVLSGVLMQVGSEESDPHGGPSCWACFVLRLDSEVQEGRTVHAVMTAGPLAR